MVCVALQCWVKFRTLLVALQNYRLCKMKSDLNVALLELSLSVYSNAYVELISLRLFLGGDGFLLV